MVDDFVLRLFLDGLIQGIAQMIVLVFLFLDGFRINLVVFQIHRVVMLSLIHVFYFLLQDNLQGPIVHLDFLLLSSFQ